MAGVMSSYWVNFAKNGDQNGKGLPNWARFRDCNAGNAAPHVLGEIKGHPAAETLNAYDAKYAELLKTPRPERRHRQSPTSSSKPSGYSGVRTAPDTTP